MKPTVAKLYAADMLKLWNTGEYPEENGHPLVYASLLNHASYFFNAPTPMPKDGTGDAHSQVQQQWAKTEQVISSTCRLHSFTKPHAASQPV